PSLRSRLTSSLPVRSFRKAIAMFRNLFASSYPGHFRRSSRRSRGRHPSPAVECLEERCVPATGTSSFPTHVSSNVAIINNGTIALGVNKEGHLNVFEGATTSASGTFPVGLRYLPTGNEATAPGCL